MQLAQFSVNPELPVFLSEKSGGVKDQVKFLTSAVLCDPELRLITFRLMAIDPKSLYDLFGILFGHVLQLVWDPD